LGCLVNNRAWVIGLVIPLLLAACSIGYQARGTPGHAIQAYGPRGGYVELDGERVDIRAGIHTLSGYSAHADRDDLTRFVTRMRHLPGEVRLVHGEDGVRAEFARHLQEATGGHVRVVV